MNYQEAISIVKLVRSMPDDFEDGMLSDIEDAVDCYRTSDKSEDDKEDFVAELEGICDEYGYPISFEKGTP